MPESRKITLKSADGVVFEVEEAIAKQSETIKHMIEDGCADNEIPLPNVAGKIMSKVIEYCKKHAPGYNEESSSKEANIDLKTWDKEFMKLDHAEIFELIMAANYLNIKDLLGLGCQTVADTIKDYSVEKVRSTFNIENDFTPEEEEAIRNEYSWAFEDCED